MLGFAIGLGLRWQALVQAIVPAAAGRLLGEDGGALLLETGGTLLMEG